MNNLVLNCQGFYLIKTCKNSNIYKWPTWIYKEGQKYFENDVLNDNINCKNYTQLLIFKLLWKKK